jgi:tetratricopeptide (TPR) repeat protein
MNDAKTWLYRGQVYRALAEDEKLSAKYPDAAMTAFNSLKKATQLDNDKAQNSALQIEYLSLAFDLYNYASTAYNNGSDGNKAEYTKAYDAFMAFQESQTLMGDEYRKKLEESLVENKIDPKKVQHLIGSSAQLSGNTDKAIEYYTQLVNSGYNEAGVYVALANLYRTKGDTAQAIAVLDKGLGVVTDKKDIINSKLDTYVRQQRYDDVISLGKEAMVTDPENIDIYIAMGNAYFEKQMPKEAEDLYSKAIAKDPNSFNTNFSLGIALYEQGRLKYNESLDANGAKATKLEDEYTALFTKAIPYLEKAQSLNKDANDKQIYQMLAEAYAKVGDMVKAKEYRDKSK